MGTRSERLILAATDDGLYLVNGTDATRVDDLAGRKVLALASDGEAAWAIVDGRELWRSGDALRWSEVTAVPKRKATCMAPTPAGLLVGTVRAHLLRLVQDQLVAVPSFDAAKGRDAWYTPWGAPADVRSIGAGAGGTLYVNVHVGGVLRSTDGGDTWQPTLDIEEDVHQVLAPSGRPGLVLVAAASGLGVSRDAGDTWTWDNDGLHAHYCRAVALVDDTVLVSASTGHHGRRAAVYRRALGGWASRDAADEPEARSEARRASGGWASRDAADEPEARSEARRASGGGAPFERCRAGLPEWFSDNVDTGCLAALGTTAVIGTEDGCVFLSRDGGERWNAVAKGLAPVRAVALR